MPSPRRQVITYQAATKFELIGIDELQFGLDGSAGQARQPRCVRARMGRLLYRVVSVWVPITLS
jgi:hypothetical protein